MRLGCLFPIVLAALAACGGPATTDAGDGGAAEASMDASRDALDAGADVPREGAADAALDAPGLDAAADAPGDATADAAGDAADVVSEDGAPRADASDACVPSCTGRVCGSDGCGGACGACLPGATCTAEGRCDCPRSSCGTAVCGRSTCGYDCGACAGAEGCFMGRCTAACPGTPCTDAHGERVCEGGRGVGVCPTDPMAFNVCTCTGGGGRLSCTAPCFRAGTARDGERCERDGDCAGGVCHPNLRRCGASCSRIMLACPPDRVCFIPGDLTGVCVPPCTDCAGRECAAGHRCVNTSIGSGGSRACVPDDFASGHTCG